MGEEGGVWRTIGGRRVFIKDGQDLKEAMKDSGKFKGANIKDKNSGNNNNNSKNKNNYKNDDKEEFEDSKGNKSTFNKVDGKTYKKALDEAKEKQPEDKAWRVDNTSHSEEDYNGMKTFVTDNGGTVAVTKDGDIVSVCGAGGDRGRTLLEYAVKNGGTKLDSYEGNFEVYTHCGFEPVSWCEFNEEYAPKDWRKGKDNPEPVVFFKYVGGKVEITREKFYSKVKASKDYDEAMNIRNRMVKK